MLRNKIKSSNKIIMSVRGEGLLLFIFFLIPVIFFIPAIAIDLSAYMATKTHLENALEAASTSALNKSIVDNYRSDKILKLKSQKVYVDNLLIGLNNNFHTTNAQRSPSTSDTKIIFTPGYAFAPNPTTLTITYNKQQESASATAGNVGVDIKLDLTTKSNLPIASKLLKLFGISDGSAMSPSITVSDSVIGIRVLNATDFKTDYNWQNKEKE